jgi:hypothetical protein
VRLPSAIVCGSLTFAGCLRIPPTNAIVGTVELSEAQTGALGADPALRVRCRSGEQTVVSDVVAAHGEFGFEFSLPVGAWSCELTGADQNGDEWYLGTLRPRGSQCSVGDAGETSESFFFVWQGGAAWLGATVTDGFDACPEFGALTPVEGDQTIAEGIHCGNVAVRYATTLTAFNSIYGASLMMCMRTEIGDDGLRWVDGALYHAMAEGPDSLGCKLGEVPSAPVGADTSLGFGFTTRADAVPHAPAFVVSGVMRTDTGGLDGTVQLYFGAFDGGEELGFVLETDGPLRFTPGMDSFPDRLAGDPLDCPL